MISRNPDTLEIICPQGDTGMLLARITDLNDVPVPMRLDGVAVFAVCKEIKQGGFDTVSVKPVDIVDNTATIHITNAFSRVIEPGNYRWDIRLVTNPDYDEQGNVIAKDDTDEVHSFFAGRPGGMPKFTVPGVAVNV